MAYRKLGRAPVLLASKVGPIALVNPNVAKQTVKQDIHGLPPLKAGRSVRMIQCTKRRTFTGEPQADQSVKARRLLARLE